MARLAALLATVAALLLPAALRAEPSGELRLRLDAALDANPAAASALARELSGAVPAPPRSELGIETDLRLKRDVLFADLRLQGFTSRDGDRRGAAKVTELYLSVPAEGLQLSGGRRVVQWDVGFGFRPNDLVQQDRSRQLLTVKPQGRYLLQAERFGADSSVSVVWVNAERALLGAQELPGPDESAVAAMGFFRQGSTDLYGFARRGARTGLSLGAAFVAVLTDSLAVHGSARALQRHDGWVSDLGPSTAPVSADPWRVNTLGRADQVLVGASWTGESKQSLLFEWWYDGTTLTNAQWNEWAVRTGALSAQTRAVLQGGTGTVPAGALAANLAWQDSPLSAYNQRRETIFLRLSWQPERWLLSLDTLYNPADSGRIVTAGLQWQGDRVRVNTALRRYGGPPDSLAARLPQRRSGLIAATWTF